MTRTSLSGALLRLESGIEVGSFIFLQLRNASPQFDEKTSSLSWASLVVVIITTKVNILKKGGPQTLIEQWHKPKFFWVKPYW